MSDFTRMTQSRIARRGAKIMAAALLMGSVVLSTVAQAQAQLTKIGFVNTERILRESAPAKAAQAKIDNEFKSRDAELKRLSDNLRAKYDQFTKDSSSSVLSDSDRAARQRELSNLDADLQRKQREFQEDFNRRRNEEFSTIVTKANDAIKRIAEQENYDLIVQDAVTVNPRIDITDKVIQSLR